MSKHNSSDDLSNVSDSNINVEKILNAIKRALSDTDENEYTEFCQKYLGEDFEKYTTSKLQQIYEIGKGLLNQYFVTQGTTCDGEILIQLQYILTNIMYNIIIKQNKDTKIETISLNKKLKETIKESHILKNDIEKKSKEMKHMKNDMKSIITTIISVILAISIIPTAIAGIEKIPANYILQFLSSIILFGIIMITFVYSIYQDKLKKSTWIILIIAVVMCICFWTSSFNISIGKANNKNDLENNELIVHMNLQQQ